MKKVYLRQIVQLCAIAGVSIGIMINCTGLFYAPICENLGILQGSFSMTGTITLLVLGCFSFAVPTLLYTFPAKQLVLAGGLLSCGATMAMAMVSSLPLFYLLAAIKGLGLGLISNTVITTIISNWFYEKSALITSIVMSFAGVFGVVLSPVFGSLVSMVGWRMAMILQGIISFVLLLPALLLPFRAFPLDQDVLPYGFVDAVDESQELPGQIPNRFSYTSALFIALVAMSFFCTGITSVGQYLAGYGTHCGLSLSAASALLSCAMAGNIVSKLLIGIIAGKLGPVKASLLMAFINFAAMVLLMLCPAFGSSALFYAASFLYGAIYSVSGVSTAMLTRYYYGPILYVKAFAVVGFVMNAAGAVTLPVIGYIYDFTHSYQLVFVFGMALNLLFCLSLLLAESRLKDTSRILHAKASV